MRELRKGADLKSKFHWLLNFVDFAGDFLRNLLLSVIIKPAYRNFVDFMARKTDYWNSVCQTKFHQPYLKMLNAYFQSDSRFRSVNWLPSI